jgi:serine/threonine protein kinase
MLLEEQRDRWQRGERVLVEAYLTRESELPAEAVLDLITNEVLLRQEAGEAPRLDEYLQRFPHLAEALRVQFEVERAINAGDSRMLASASEPTFVGPLSGSETVPPAVAGYEILGELGRGGMGVVYKARHIRLKRTVALKMILAGGHAGPDELNRFRIEAEAAARLQHPNIVQIHEVGEADGHPYCALEFVEGGSLAGKLDRPLPPREAARVVEALARGMHAAHSHHVVHRDLKPANVLLAADGTPKITDFGLARQMDADSAQTQSGAVLGTPSYMAPEQASGHARDAGPAMDIYALGAILYACLTARPPFQGRTPLDTLDQVRTQDPLPPSRIEAMVPFDLETICLKAMAKEPGRRYPTAADLAADLRRFLDGEPIQARRLGVTEKMWRRVRRNPALFGLAAAVVVLGSVVVGVVATRARPEPTVEVDTSADDLLRVAADLDRTDPGWRLEQIETKRKGIPDEENGALQIARFRKLAAEERGGSVGDGQERIAPTARERMQAIEQQPQARLSPADSALFKQELGRLERALQAARQMTRYPSGRFNVNFARDAYSTNLTNWTAGRYLADVLQLDALVQIQAGNQPAAVTNCLAMLNAARTYTDEPFAHIQWQGMIIVHQSLQVVERLLAQGACSDADLTALQRVAMEVEVVPILVTMARGDRAAHHYFLSSLEAGDPPGSNVLPSIGIKDRAELPGGKDMRRFHVWLLQHWTEFVAIAGQPPEKQPPLLKGLDEKRATAPLAGTPLFLALTRTSVEATAVTRQLAELRCGTAALAVERYRLAQGKWPTELAATVPAYLKEVPKDPYDGLPLRYRRTSDGVVVYCLGPDQADNLGKLDRTVMTTVPPYLKEVQMDSYLREVPADPPAAVDLGFQLWDAARRR